MTNYSDNALMMDVRNGDLDKMGLLFERYHKQLLGFLYNMTRQRDEAEDMVQVVFFKMLKYRQSFNGTGSFKTWMYHVARNVLNDHYRKVKKTPAYREVADIQDSLPSEQYADDLVQKKQEIALLYKAMDSLSAENRELLLLCRFQDLKYHEIAEILNITEGAVKVRVHRALNQLKGCFLQITQ